AAFHAIAEAKVDLGIIEVGLGGRLDATNVIERPLCAAITSIALEHTAQLGGTIAQIAREKAGILKPGAPAVVGPVDAEAARAIEETARAVAAGPIAWVRRGAEGERPRPALPGPHQIDNAAVAAEIARVLATRWPRVA